MAPATRDNGEGTLVHDSESRLRALETQYVELRAKCEPLFTLAPAIQQLTLSLGEVQRDLAVIKAQALLLCGAAALVAPGVFAVVEVVLSKLWK